MEPHYMGDMDSSLRRFVVTRSLAVGILYTVAFHLWVLTELEVFGLVPPAVLFVYYIAYANVTSFWTCPECGARSTARQCRVCGATKTVDETSAGQAGLYTIIIPAGAILTEFLAVTLMDMAFRAFGNVAFVAWYEVEWYSSVGLFGPMGLFLLTLTAPIAYLLAVGIGTSWAQLTRLVRSVR